MSIKQRVSKLETKIGKTDPFHYLNLLSDEQLDAMLRILCLKAGIDSTLPHDEFVKAIKLQECRVKNLDDWK